MRFEECWCVWTHLKYVNQNRWVVDHNNHIEMCFGRECPYFVFFVPFAHVQYWPNSELRRKRTVNAKIEHRLRWSEVLSVDLEEWFQRRRVSLAEGRS